MTNLKVRPSGPLRGSVTIPGDKSISHRAVILGSIATGRTRIGNLLEAEDVLRTVAIIRELGIAIDRNGSCWIVDGKGLQGLSAPSRILDCGNSGTTLRLMTGLLASFPFTSALT